MALSSRNPQPISIVHPNSPVTESFRTIRTNIQFSSVVNEVQVIVFTSTLPSEGKTSTTSNVAVVSAQAGKRVLLIDADMRKPQIHHRFQISNLDGLSSVLIRERNSGQCIVETNVLNLYILPSGPIPPNPSEMLSSRMFARFIEECRKDFDLILIDSPPVLSVTDALLLSQVADGVVFVIDAHQTNRVQAKRAVAALEQVNAKILGAVLNRVDKRDSGYAYSYYYSAEESASV